MAAIGLALVISGIALGWVIRPRLPAAERGRRLAEQLGCYACHGAEGRRGAANPGRADRTVPGFGAELMMYAKSRDEVREWIRDGVTAARARSRSWLAERERGVLRMPAFGGRLSARQLEDLVEFVLAASGQPEPDDSLAARGLERAEALGCTGCHGAGGRYARRNPGSLKGYVPSWGGPDFAELVADRQEFAAWVERGRPPRLERNPLARFFLDRAVLRMPAYGDRVPEGDLDALWAYVCWLRDSSERDSK